MDTTKPQQPQKELPENESHMLPKLEDMIAVTGLFTPSLIIEELRELDRLDEPQENTGQNS